MILSKRERYIGIATAAVFGLLLGDRYILSPLVAQRNQVAAETATVQLDLDRNARLFQTRRRLTKEWAGMISGGLKADVSAAESQVLNAVLDWARESGLSLASLKPERTETDHQFQKITFRATGTGNLGAMNRFLWRVREAKIPVRITDVQLNSRKEGTDDLGFQFGVSTLYLAPEVEKKTEKVAFSRE